MFFDGFFKGNSLFERFRQKAVRPQIETALFFVEIQNASKQAYNTGRLDIVNPHNSSFDYNFDQG